ncbi:hypothetical protein PK35_07070 [Tamlana nanhaiensis]|uniref:ABC transporter domain-containing protein n=1 Tax=Neotamlana nanhaiensis TaxID=1382798 RepID=A0A0D7W4G7_9FLAO|nr:ATP-binding cassette domain-containing protein [Tamlana nanhaiensis]KJD33593.1 hypothetical protein PK35_07070 [Tamlana nanhaiensis]
MAQHTAFYLSNKDDKKKLIQDILASKVIPETKNLNGALFSEATLNKFIDEELRHGKMDITTKVDNSLYNSSEGERKQALLKHIIAKAPDYIILDNVFGSLDIEAQKQFKTTLEALSKYTLLIQISNRLTDVLPFIQSVFCFKNEALVAFNPEENKQDTAFNLALPQPYKNSNEDFDTLIKFNEVTVKYGDRTIIKDISWTIKPGEFWKLIGPNGSGKSTMLSMIYGDNPKAYGQDIHLFGVKKGSGESVWELKKKMGYFTADMVRGFARLDSIGNMVVSGFFDSVGLYKTPSHLEIEIAHQWLKVLGLFEVRKQSFVELTKGQQRLVLIARAMVKSPPLLILDEPTNGLDDTEAALFANLINKIAKETNTAILYVSHRIEEQLNPDFIFELKPTESGSLGSIS